MSGEWIDPVPPAPPVSEIWEDPHQGDLLCFDGLKWCVARRNGWYYPVEEPTQEQKIAEYMADIAGKISRGEIKLDYRALEKAVMGVEGGFEIPPEIVQLKG